MPRHRALALVLALLAVACTAQSSTGPARASGAEPTAGQWRTWVLASPAEVTVPPPPAPGSEEALAEARELQDALAFRTRDALDTIATWDGVGEPISGPWMRMAFDLVSARPADPPAASRAYALLSVAAYDAMVASWYYKYRYQRPAPAVVEKVSESGPDPSYPSEHAAIAGAMSQVLAYLFPEQSARHLADVTTEVANSRVLAGANWRSDTRAGLDLGRQVADQVIARAHADGFSTPCTREAPGGPPQFWAPPPGVVASPVQPCAGEWRTWVLESGSQFRPEPPPPFGDPAFEDQAYQAIQVKKDLTAEQKRTATFWAAGERSPQPAGLWNELTIAYLRTRRPSEPQAERALALANVALADAGVAAWDAKYTFWDPRPENAVADLGFAPGWKPFLAATPLSPSYISAQGTYAGAIAEVLSWVFPENEPVFRFHAGQSVDSRLWGGVDWDRANTTGLEVGTKVGRLVVDKARSDGAPRLPPVKR